MQQADQHDTRTLEFPKVRSGDTLYQIGEVFAFIGELVAARNPEGEITLTHDGAAGLSHIIGAAVRRINDFADDMNIDMRQDRNTVREEYDRGFANGIAEGRRQMENKHELLKRVGEIVNSLPMNEAAADVAPEPRLTEPAAAEGDALPAKARA